MTETSTFEFWFLVICVAVYAHFLQLSIHTAHGSANDERPDAKPDLLSYGRHALARVSTEADLNSSGASGDAAFDAAAFLDGAWTAYEKIVQAYADGDTASLQPLLGGDAYSVFETAIAERRRKGEQVELIFVRVQPPKIVDADIQTDIAHVTVRFDSELVTTTRAANDRIVSGDPHKVVNVRDIWTFTRNTSSPDPTWKLIATNAE
ncbi:MAG: Tim44/TimA family putative adaptor protein [Variibacter sp.]